MSERVPVDDFPSKGPRTPLRFTKTLQERPEKTYARHFVWPGKGPFRRPREKSDAGV